MSRRRSIVSSMISTFSQPLLSANLPSPEERERQKHRILENLHGAIKEVQVQEFSVSDDLPTTLTIHDTSCQQLCRHLDHAFLHGLRHLANGYWLFVKEFTHKDTVDVIHNLKNVNSNLGKGRAWLYISLNESSLESYIRTIHVNPSIVDKYYISEAFVRDEQQMEMLITMVSGLEYVPFQLEIDSPFLNHSIVPMQNDGLNFVKKETSSFGSCSMNSSFLSQKSVASLESPAISQDEDSGFVNMESSQITLLDLNIPPNHINSVTDNLDINKSNPYPSDDHTAEFIEESLEVIHVSTKKSKRKKKIGANSTCNNSALGDPDTFVNQDSRSMKMDSPVDIISSTNNSEDVKHLSMDQQQSDTYQQITQSSNLTETPFFSISESKNTREYNHENHIDCEENCLQIENSVLTNCDENISSQSLESCSTTSIVIESTLTERRNSDLDNNSNADMTLKNESDVKNNSKAAEIIIEHSSSVSEVKPAIKFRDKGDTTERKNPAKRVSFEIDLPGNDLVGTTRSSVFGEDEYFTVISSYHSQVKNNNKMPSAENYELEMLRGSPEGQEMPDGFASNFSSSDEPSIYDRKNNKPMSSKSKPMSFLTDFPKVNKTEVTERSRQYAQEIDSELKKAMTEKRENADIKVDNDTLLRLMLDVFFEGEQFYKMYCASVGHTENKLRLLFPVLTDKRLYLLVYHPKKQEFVLSMAISYSEIDYILLGINYQTIQIICKRRRKHFALCTGDEYLTRSIVSSLEVAIRRWCHNTNLPCVYTDAMMQTIGLQKFIANEINIERHEVIITYYALVHWEELQLPSSSQSPAGPSKEGHLMYRFCQDQLLTFKPKTQWIPAYFVLRAGVFYQFKAKGCTQNDCYIRLNGREFRGCKRSSQWKRPHVFQLQLKNGYSMHLAAANEYEVSDWLQSFIRSQTASNKAVKPDKSCCLVLASQKLFICQEDLEMFTFTTLASANLCDLVEVKVDNENNLPYCILEFESVEANVCTGDWILYFNSENEIKKFLTVLEDSWKESFKISLLVTEIEDTDMKKKCVERMNAIRSSWKIGYDMIKESSTTMKYCPSPQ